VFELVAQLLAEADGFGGDIVAGRKIGKKEEHGESVVKIAEGIDEGGISLLDDVVEFDLGHEVLLKACGISSFAATKRACNLLRYRLVLAELGEERFMEEIRDVLRVVEGCGSSGTLGDLLLLARFAGVDS